MECPRCGKRVRASLVQGVIEEYEFECGSRKSVVRWDASIRDTLVQSRYCRESEGELRERGYAELSVRMDEMERRIKETVG